MSVHFGFSACIITLPQSQHLAVGTVNGLVQIWDAAAEKKVATLHGHSARVGECPACTVCNV